MLPTTIKVPSKLNNKRPTFFSTLWSKGCLTEFDYGEVHVHPKRIKRFHLTTHKILKIEYILPTLHKLCSHLLQI